MAKKSVDPSQLPQTDESWFVCLRPVSLDLKDGPARPTALILVNLTAEHILQLDIYETPPDASLVRERLLQTMRRPEHGDLTPRRPQAVQFEQADLLERVAPALQTIQVAAGQGKAPALVDALLAELSGAFGAGQAEPQGLLSVPGTSPKMIAGLFEAAAEFYRQAPWRRIADYQTLAVTMDPPGELYFVQVMGNGGMEFGLSLYTRWEDVLRMFEDAAAPLEKVPESGMHGLTFESKDYLPPADQEALRKYGWKTAGRKAHPMPVIYTRDGRAERPPRQELLVYEALLRALPAFIEQHLVEDGRGDFEPAQAVIESRHADGPVRLTIQYPAGELPTTDDEELWLQEMEQLVEGKPIQDLPASVLEANRLADQAWREQDTHHRLALARQALEISPDCSEAYLVLAYESEAPEESKEWLEKAVQAGERLLGQEFLETHAGEIWDWRQARPYLRARGGLAEMLEELGQFDEALAQHLALLRLDEADHQGARYDAMRLLLLLKRDQPAAELLDRYAEDGSAIWAFSRALLAFRQSGDAARSRSLLKKAQRTNRHVYAYLIGLKPLPAEAPVAVGFGDESEAIEYALEHYAVWWGTPGAVDWLKQRG